MGGAEPLKGRRKERVGEGAGVERGESEAETELKENPDSQMLNKSCTCCVFL